MAWPTVAVNTTNCDSDTDNPANARVDILDALQKLNQIIAHVSTFVATIFDDVDAAAVRTTIGAAPLASPTFTGTPAGPTAAPGTNTTQFSTTAFVKAAIDVVLGGVSSAFDTLSEIATELGLKAPLASPTFTGTPLETMGTGSGTAALIGKASINTTTVGNIGGGTDDLMTYSIPANSLSANGKGIRITAWGATGNNANAKTLIFTFGATNAGVTGLTVSIAGAWVAQVVIVRSAANTQVGYLTVTETVNGSSPVVAPKAYQVISFNSLFETDTSAIVTKFMAQATADNDIIQRGMLVEYIG